ncbi:ATP-binding cassette domain-containing protein [Parascardovia denticolens]|uniref:ATP-binding cassette domain-containing protein n=1 Tax=Parascardovia denticolens TaxID=78258 RepID=UPI003CD0D776
MLDADSAASSHADSRVDSAVPAKVVGLDVDGLSAFYDQERRVGVSGVSLHARKGQIVAFVGRNGAGKTTTVKALTGMLASEQGTITLTLEGEKGAPQGRNLDLGSMDFFSRRPYMSVMVQDYNRFELTVRQTWLWGRSGISFQWKGRGRSAESGTAGFCGMLWTRSGRRGSWRGSRRGSIPSWARSGAAWTFPAGNGNG